MSAPRHAARPAHLFSLLLLVGLPLLVVGLIAEDLLEKERFQFEEPLMTWIHAHSGPALTSVAVFLHHFGGPYVMVPVFLGLAAYLWQRKQHHLANFTLIALAGAAILNAAMKLVFNRARPELWPRIVTEGGASFPSGHSMFAAALSTVLVLLAWRTRWRYLALTLGVAYTLLMLYSRMLLGVHYPTDVLAGALSGMAWTYGVYRLMGGRPLKLDAPVSDKEVVSG